MPRAPAQRRRPSRPTSKASAKTASGEATAHSRLLAGAGRVFEEKGLRAASVEDILRAAKVSRRTFYKLYTDKEDVAIELYRLGTDALVETCERAVQDESEPRRMLERCVDAHLHNASTLGRLVFVLGGEAQRHESRLHRIRMQVHERIVKVLDSAASRAGRNVDPLLIRALIFALEGTTRLALEKGNEGRRTASTDLEGVRRVMMQLAECLLEA